VVGKRLDVQLAGDAVGARGEHGEAVAAGGEEVVDGDPVAGEGCSVTPVTNCCSSRQPSWAPVSAMVIR
jgi:hypothetical protein